MTPGAIIRDARKRHGLSQQRLAMRAGTRQSAISRLEKDEVSPSVETMELLLNAMGEKLSLIAEPMDRDYDPLHMTSMKNRQPAERLALAISWNRTAGRLRRAGEESRAQSGKSG
jgi:transcriptional regulator with XRE-family HTH domain